MLHAPRFVIAAVLVLSAPAAVVAGTAEHHHAEAARASALLHDAAGNLVGMLTLHGATDGHLMVMGDLSGLTPGEHGFHIHEKGVCEAPFTSAGGHFNPAGRQHGRDNPQGRHAGDLSNIAVGPDGTAKVHQMLQGVSIAGEGGLPAVLDADGAAFIVHADPDDNRSDPAGNAGPRVACGVITPR